jgi:hypothetical protein
MTLAEIRAKWEARQVEANRFATTVSLAAIANDVLEDLGQIADPNAEATVTPGRGRGGARPSCRDALSNDSRWSRPKSRHATPPADSIERRAKWEGRRADASRIHQFVPYRVRRLER